MLFFSTNQLQKIGSYHSAEGESIIVSVEEMYGREYFAIRIRSAEFRRLICKEGQRF